MVKDYDFPAATLRICIDDEKKENKKGRVYCRLFQECLYFEDLGQLLVKADRMFDEVGFPQAYHRSGSFTFQKNSKIICSPNLYLTEKELQQKKGEVSTVYIIIRSRRRSGWQGTYIDCRGEPSDFISEMELLEYMIRG